MAASGDSFTVFSNPFQLKKQILYFLVVVTPYGCRFDTVLCCTEHDRSRELMY